MDVCEEVINERLRITLQQRPPDADRYGHILSWSFPEVPLHKGYSRLPRFNGFPRFVWYGLDWDQADPWSITGGQGISRDLICLSHLTPLVIGRAGIPIQHNQGDDLDEEPSDIQVAASWAASCASLAIGWWLIWYGRAWWWQALGGLLVVLPFLLIPIMY